jgi:LuxR family transcriptional regulator, maltose regulon positive regulatory protein
MGSRRRGGSGSRAIIPRGMTDPIATKFSPPVRAAHQVVRAGLLRRLDDAVSGRRLTLIHAPAGYGKTSLLTQWHRTLKERGLEVIWLTLEEEESDAVRFADSLMVGVVDVRMGENAPLRAATSAIVNRFVKTPGDVVIILDDFQRAESDSVCGFLRALLRLLPPTVHVVISSRDRPKLGYAELAADHDLLEIGSADLRFSLEEAEIVFRSVAGPPLAPDEISRLVERTEGWPIAVQMSALSLRTGRDRGERISEFTGPDWQLASYLSEQVLAGLPPDLEAVVTSTAILNRVNGELVNLLCNRTDGPLILEQLERQDLFIVPLDPEHVTYRYHQLFADILSARLKRRDIQAFHRLHCIAARWFAARSQVLEAVRHARLSNDNELLAQVLDDAGGWRLIPEGKMDALVTGLEHLPEQVITQYPRLMLARVYRLIKQGEMDAARSAYDSFRESTEHTGLTTEVNLVGEVLAEYENAPVQLDDLLSKEALIRSLPSHDHLMLSNVYESLGSKYCECGWLERAIEPIRRARTHHQALRSLYGELFTHFLESRVVLAQGRLDEARVILDEAAASIQNAYGPRSDLAANCAAHQAEVRFEQGAVSEAIELLDWALPHMERSDGWFEVYASAFAAAIRSSLATSPDDVQTVIVRMRDTAQRRHLLQLQLLADIYDVEVLIFAGRISDAQMKAETVGIDRLADTMREEFPVYRQVAIAAAVCRIKLKLCAEDPGGALSEIEGVQRWAQQHGHGRLLITLSILAARAHEQAGNVRNAAARFDDAVSMSMFQGFMGPFLDCRRFLPFAALQDQSQDVGAHDTDRFREKYMRRLRRLLRSTSIRQGESTILSAAELLTLRHLDKGFTNKEIARLLKVSPNTVKYRLKSLFAKMGVTSRRAAVQLSREQGLLSGPREREA